MGIWAFGPLTLNKCNTEGLFLHILKHIALILMNHSLASGKICQNWNGNLMPVCLKRLLALLWMYFAWLGKITIFCSLWQNDVTKKKNGKNSKILHKLALLLQLTLLQFTLVYNLILLMEFSQILNSRYC